MSTIGEDVIDSNQQVTTAIKETLIIKDKLAKLKNVDTNSVDIIAIKAKEVHPKKLSNPLIKIGKTIVKKTLSNEVDVVCKFQVIGEEDRRIQELLTILEKLKESNNILKFYGLSKVDDLQVMVFEWAEYGSLQEMYNKYDIGWRSKVQIALGICRGLVFIQTCEILHHDIRCANVMVCWLIYST